jgi:hypothetical protein
VNNKNIKYLLLAAAVCVWGLVIYNIIKGLAKDDIPKAITNNPMPKVDYSIKNDSFIINYPDPFIPEIDTLQQKMDSLNKQLKATVPVTITPPPPPFQNITSIPPSKPDVSFIQYLGRVTNTEVKNKKAGFINLRGKDVMIKEGQKIEDIIIKKIEKNKLTIFYQKQQLSILSNTN